MSCNCNKDKLKIQHLAVITNEVVTNDYYDFKSVKNPENIKYVVDMGANFGVTSLFAAKLFPNATIFAVEPFTHDELVTRTKHEPRIVTLRAALGRNGEAVKCSNPENRSYGGFQGVKDEFGVPCRSFGGLLELFHIKEEDYSKTIIKMDIEGAEYHWKDELGIVKDGKSYDGYDYNFKLINKFAHFSAEFHYGNLYTPNVDKNYYYNKLVEFNIPIKIWKRKVHTCRFVRGDTNVSK